MVVTNIIGGLGNQMFQYAAGRALSLRKKVRFALDASAFDTYSLHQGFELINVFSCNPSLVDRAAIERLIGWQGNPLVRRALGRKSMAFLRSKRLAIEPHYEYWSGINDLPDDCFLSGYWQSERYFADVDEQIRNDFVFAQLPSPENQALIERITRANAISLHVRRGDYVNNVANASIYTVCSPGYYRDAINFLVERISNPKFFVFSDDMAWVRTHLDIGFPVEYVDHNRGADSYNDMRLMSLCKHNIIANSSFSWWGAWLNRSEEKIVIAPKQWFANQTITKDLLPKSWIQL
jgi:hypothetical protein